MNYYVEPVYTLDANLVVFASSLAHLSAHLQSQGFRMEAHPDSLNAWPPRSKLRIQFSTDERYQDFLSRAMEQEVLSVLAKVACREDVTRRKLWAYGDPRRRLSKRKKDELDLIRIGEKYPQLIKELPDSIRSQFGGSWA